MEIDKIKNKLTKLGFSEDCFKRVPHDMRCDAFETPLSNIKEIYKMFEKVSEKCRYDLDKILTFRDACRYITNLEERSQGSKYARQAEP